MLLFAIVPFVLAVPAPRIASPAEEPHPFTIHDMLSMERISDPQVSPDGKWVAYTVRTTDLDANRGRNDVWVSAVDGSSSKQLTVHEASDSSARWMPDGRSLVFLSSRSGSSQVWRIAVDGGEAEQLTKLPIGVDGVLPFPDGERLLLAMEVYADAPKETALADTAKRDEAAEKNPVKARTYETLLFRHWDTWEDGKRSHVFAWKIGGGDPVDLMPGFDGDSPTKPFGGIEEVAISPDGREVAFTAIEMKKDAAWTTDADVWTVPADASAPPQCRTTDNLAMDTQPAYSPDGRTLAWLAMERPGYEADRYRIVLHDRQGAKTRVLTQDFDRSCSSIVWAADSKTIWTTADNLGNHSLFAIDAGSGAPRVLVEKGTNASPCPAGSRLVYAQDTLKSPVELWSITREGGDPKPVTKRNEAKVRAASMGDYEQFTFVGAKGERVMGFVVKPVGFVEGKRYPVAFLIHGGPQGSFGDHFHYRWNPQAYAGAGYAAVFIDFHGSTGYGQAFTDAIHEDWGGAPYEDLMKGLDHALERYTYLDRDRVAALGASFGGYMVNWIAGQTDRFRCLVSHDGNLDERMAYYDTEELWFPEWDHGGTPWEHPEGYTKHNPIEHVAKWKTPMLVIHGALDYRVVDTQGMSTFTALQRRGIASKFLYFPDENHWVLKPKNSILWHETVLGWLGQWCQGEKSGGAPGSSGR